VEALLESGGTFAVKRVDFIWINRSAGAFEWFVEMLLEVEELKRRFPKMRDYVHLHTYLTGLKPSDMNSLILCLSLQAYYEKEGVDAITGCVVAWWNTFLSRSLTHSLTQTHVSLPSSLLPPQTGWKRPSSAVAQTGTRCSVRS
jgi:hypothetical protein